MAEYIERENYCKNICLCNEKECGKEKCSIHTAPAADVVEVRHGEWVYCPETITLRSHFYCSACNSARYEHYAKNNFRYCPNCGAKMDGKGD